MSVNGNSDCSDNAAESDPLLKRVVEQLDNQASSLDAETLSRLNQARVDAVAASPAALRSHIANRRKRFSMPMGAALASVLALIVVLQFDDGDGNSIPLASLDADLEAVLNIDNGAFELFEAEFLSADEIELIISSDDLDFYQGIAFIEWLNRVEVENLQPVGRQNGADMDMHAERSSSV